MRQVELTTKFKGDLRRLFHGIYGKSIQTELDMVVELLCLDYSLPQKNFDHPLKGKWRGHRECHIRPDLLLIYRKPNDQHLELTRIGSHSELSLV